jgi:PRTRC genetic system protein C
MLTVNILPRIFIHTEDKHEVRLTDPSEKFTPEAVLNFYANTYPILTNAKIEGPEIENDELVYRFTSTLGTKG